MAVTLWRQSVVISLIILLFAAATVRADDEVIYDPDGYIGATMVMVLHELPEGLGKITRPWAVATASDGRIYVLDSKDRVLIFSPSGEFIKAFGKTGRRSGEFREASALTIDRQDRIFVADTGNSRIQVFDSEGNYLYEFGQAPPRRGEPGPGQLKRVIALAISPDDLVYAVDIDSHRVHVFNLDGEFQFAFGEFGTGDGQLNYPVGIGFDQDGYVYVVNALNFRMEIFSPEGEFDYRFGKAGDTVGTFARPKTIAFDSNGYLYVTDSMLNLIQIMDWDGEYLGRIGGHAETPLFAQPFGIWIDANDTLFVADRGNDRIVVFDLFALD
ncbi:MAG: 6-bladed beta-propeller [Firmicutes bacterium]|nr:6-bladed beta-propeller [Bacillota bacterium]